MIQPNSGTVIWNRVPVGRRTPWCSGIGSQTVAVSRLVQLVVAGV